MNIIKITTPTDRVLELEPGIGDVLPTMIVMIHNEKRYEFVRENKS